MALLVLKLDHVDRSLSNVVNWANKDCEEVKWCGSSTGVVAVVPKCWILGGCFG